MLQGPGGPDLSVLRGGGSILMLNLAYALHTAELYLARLWLPLLLVAALVQSGREPGEAAVLAATWSGAMFMTGSVGVFLGGMVSDRMGRTAGAGLIFAVSGTVSFLVGWLVGAPDGGANRHWGLCMGLLRLQTRRSTLRLRLSLRQPNRIGSTQGVQNFIGFSVGAVAPVLAGRDSRHRRGRRGLGASVRIQRATWRWAGWSCTVAAAGASRLSGDGRGAEVNLPSACSSRWAGHELRIPLGVRLLPNRIGFAG